MLAVPAVGQESTGDTNGNGMVTIDKILVAVNNALHGCVATSPTPTRTPTPTPTRLPATPTKTPALTRCSQTFLTNTSAGDPLCRFEGTWNATCGTGTLRIAFIRAAGGLVLGVASNAYLWATINSASRLLQLNHVPAPCPLRCHCRSDTCTHGFGDRLQNRFGSPACLSTMFAQCRDLILPSTGNRWPVTGLNQMSWSPFPCRSKRQPASRKMRFNSGV